LAKVAQLMTAFRCHSGLAKPKEAQLYGCV
jgi:hypothetical protein